MISGQYLTMAEVVDLTGYTQAYLRRLLREGQLKGTKIGPRLWLVDPKAAEKLAKLEQSTGRPRHQDPKKLKKSS